jgi:acetyl esterase/lipase
MKYYKLRVFRRLVKIINDAEADRAPETDGIIAYPNISYCGDRLEGHKLDVSVPAERKAALPAVIYFHGGGWSLSDKKHFRYFCQRVAAGGYAVFNANYRLAPEYSHPAQLMDALSAMEWVKLHAGEYGADPSRVFLAGDSSGAHLASLAACVCTGPELAAHYKVPVPYSRRELCGCVLFCGSYDLLSCVESQFPLIKDYVGALLGTGDTAGYPDIDTLSSVKQMNSDFPPTLVSDAVQDKLIGQSRSLIEAMERNGVRHTDLLLEDTGGASPHEYQIEYKKPVFDTCMDATLNFLRECTAAQQGVASSAVSEPL